MDIKLRARLSAYSKINSISDVNSNIPLPEASDAGNVLGVGDTGNYTLFPPITEGDIDILFTNQDENDTVTKEEIDTLFPETKEPETITKEEIDTLFPKNQGANTEMKKVSYSDIDSLFN